MAVLGVSARQAEMAPERAMEAEAGASLRAAVLLEVERPAAVPLAMQPWVAGLRAWKASVRAWATARSIVQGPLGFRPR